MYLSFYRITNQDIKIQFAQSNPKNVWAVSSKL